jgi:alkylation response protein AidB-like acyl-CoA dehydrogenase
MAVDFQWSEGDAAFRRELRTFLEKGLPENWRELSVHGPGSDAQAAFSREFCGALAQRGWLTQMWPKAYGGADATPWRHAILSEEMWRVGEPRGSHYL